MYIHIYTGIYRDIQGPGFSTLGVSFGGRHSKDDSVLGSLLGSPYLGRKLPHLIVLLLLCVVQVLC